MNVWRGASAPHSYEEEGLILAVIKVRHHGPSGESAVVIHCVLVVVALKGLRAFIAVFCRFSTATMTRWCLADSGDVAHAPYSAALLISLTRISPIAPNRGTVPR
jgi:hypothetical protein